MSILKRLFGRSGPNMGQKLRETALAITPEQLGVEPGPDEPFAAFMEFSFPGACATLSMMAEGSTSFYFSNGGGMIGGGQHEAVRQETMRFLELSRTFIDKLTRTEDFTLPPQGTVRLLLKTSNGFYGASAPELELQRGNSPFSPLYMQGQNVITRFREADVRSSAMDKKRKLDR